LPTPFQVREARACLCRSIPVCSAVILRFYGWCDFLNAWNALACWFVRMCGCAGKWWREIDALAQARLAETS